MKIKFALLSLAFSVCACTAPVNPNQTVVSLNPGVKRFVGHVLNSDALVAFTVEGNQISAYACGGEQTLGLSGWFRGNVDGSRIEVNSDNQSVIKGSWSAAGPDQASSAAGDITLPDGSKMQWQVDAARDKSPAGLYRYAESNQSAGVIITNDGQAQGVYSMKAPPAAGVSVAAQDAPSEGRFLAQAGEHDGPAQPAEPLAIVLFSSGDVSTQIRLDAKAPGLSSLSDCKQVKVFVPAFGAGSTGDEIGGSFVTKTVAAVGSKGCS